MAPQQTRPPERFVFARLPPRHTPRVRFPPRSSRNRRSRRDRAQRLRARSPPEGLVGVPPGPLIRSSASPRALRGLTGVAFSAFPLALGRAACRARTPLSERQGRCEEPTVSDRPHQSGLPAPLPDPSALRAPPRGCLRDSVVLQARAPTVCRYVVWARGAARHFLAPAPRRLPGPPLATLRALGVRPVSSRLGCVTASPRHPAWRPMSPAFWRSRIPAPAGPRLPARRAARFTTDWISNRLEMGGQ